MAKILFIHHACMIGGGTISAADVVSMIEEKHKVYVLCSTVKNEAKDYFETKGFECIEYADNMGLLAWYSGGPNFISRTFFYALYKINKFKNFILQQLNSIKPDIVIINSIVLCWLGPILKKRGIKCLCFVRETKKNGPIAMIQKLLLSYFNGVCFISDYDKESFNIKSTNVYVVRDCVKKQKYEINISKNNIYKLYNINRNKRNVLYLGGQSYIKGWNVVKQVLEKSLDKELLNVNFLILGDINESEKIKGANIYYLGMVVDVEYIYKCADVIILPSTKPHQLRPIIEAGFARCPVIVSWFEQISENIIENMTCLTIEPNDYYDLINKIKKLIYNDKLRGKLIENNYEFVKERYEYNKVKEKLLDIIKSTIVNINI